MPSRVAADCMFYSQANEECVLSDEELEFCCPCVNGEIDDE